MRYAVTRWRSVAVGLCAAVMAVGALLPATGAQASAYPTISGEHSGKCLDDTNGSTQAANQMQIWTCNGLQNQGWTLYAGGWTCGTFCGPGAGSQMAHAMFRNVKSGLCLNMMGGSSARNGSAVAQWPCNSGDLNQWWDIDATNRSGYYIFQNVGSLLCMTVSADSQSNGAKVQGWNDSQNNCPLYTDTSYFWTAEPLGSPPS